MSFVREIVNLVNSSDSQESLKEINCQLIDLQYAIQNQIALNCTEFLPAIKKNETYIADAEIILQNTNELIDNVRAKKSGEIKEAQKNLLHDIENVEHKMEGLSVSIQILKILETLDVVQMAKKMGEQARAIKLVNELRDLLKHNQKVFGALKCYKNIRMRVTLEHEELLHKLKESFEGMVILNNKTFNNTQAATIQITQDKNKLSDVVLALITTKYNPKIMCRFIMDNVFVPIMTRPVALRFDDNVSGFLTLSISFSSQPSPTLRTPYKMIFQNIETVFDFLNNMNVIIENNTCMISLIGAHIKEEFCKMLITECLHNAVPETVDEKEISSLAQDIKDLIMFLEEKRFLQDSDLTLQNFMDTIDILFRKRFCEQIITNANRIMKKNLHDVIVVENNLITSASDPRNCIISSCMQELINLLDNTIAEMLVSDPKTAAQLDSTIKHIMALFIIEMPHYHEKNLNTVPHLSALFYNNSVYFTNWTVKLNHTPDMNLNILASDIHMKGCQILDRQLKIQKDQLWEIMNEIDFSEDTQTSLSQSVNKIIRQLMLLKNVWQAVLPPSKYNKCMGGLLDDICVGLIRKITQLEDISTTQSDVFNRTIEQVIQKSQELFEDPTEIILHVQCWTKFNQLKTILNASLLEINEQWADGKGTIAMNFSVVEMKSLIRALFQNTKRRELILHSISK